MHNGNCNFSTISDQPSPIPPPPLPPQSFDHRAPIPPAPTPRLSRRRLPRRPKRSNAAACARYRLRQKDTAQLVLLTEEFARCRKEAMAYSSHLSITLARLQVQAAEIETTVTSLHTKLAMLAHHIPSPVFPSTSLNSSPRVSHQMFHVTDHLLGHAFVPISYDVEGLG